MQVAALPFATLLPATPPAEAAESETAVQAAGFGALMRAGEDAAPSRPDDPPEAAPDPLPGEPAEAAPLPPPAAFWIAPLPATGPAPRLTEVAAAGVDPDAAATVPPVVAAMQAPAAQASSAQAAPTAPVEDPGPTDQNDPNIADSATSPALSARATTPPQDTGDPLPLPLAAAPQERLRTPPQPLPAPMTPADPPGTTEPAAGGVPSYWLLRIAAHPGKTAEPPVAPPGASDALPPAITTPALADAPDALLAPPPPPAAAPPNAASPVAPPPAAPPAAIATQIVAALPASPGAPVELRLSPAELGRLRLRLSPEGDGLRVTIEVERPETLDLIRRHADLLFTEIRSADFAGGSLSFGSWSGGGNGTDHPAPPGASPTRQTGPDMAEGDAAPAPPIAGAAAPGTLNLRL